MSTDTKDAMRRFCPYAQRTVLVLNAKGVDYQIINCALMSKPDWLFKLNPLGTYRNPPLLSPIVVKGTV